MLPGVWFYVMSEHEMLSARFWVKSLMREHKLAAEAAKYLLVSFRCAPAALFWRERVL